MVESNPREELASFLIYEANKDVQQKKNPRIHDQCTYFSYFFNFFI